jgi:hypothetical protein
MRNRLPEALQVARSLRRTLRRRDGSSYCQCREWGAELVQALVGAGIQARLASMVVRHEGYEEDGRVVWEIDDDCWSPHCVAMVGDHIVDITADQFNKVMRRKYPAVVHGVMGRGPMRYHEWCEDGPEYLDYREYLDS